MLKQLRGREMRIAEIECIRVTLPIEAPILTSYGSLGSYARSIIRVRTEDGLVGYGDVSARVGPETIRTIAPMIVGLSVWDTSIICRRIKNWNYYPWTKPEPVMAAIEMACLDIQGKALDLPVYQLLGGKMRDEIPVAGYVFFRHANSDGAGQVHSVEEALAFAHSAIKRHGFTSLKLKGGYFKPEHDRDTLMALREEFGRDLGLRIDPQGAWSVATAIRIGKQLEPLGLDYYEDPVWGAAAMAQVRKAVNIPLATNMCVTQFEELYPAFNMGAVDIVLSDIWYWGGVKACLALERVCGTVGLDVGMHSGTELAIGWAAMIHCAAAMPNLKLSADYMNMHLVDDIGVEPRIMPRDGVVSPPEGPGLGVTIDDEKLDRYAKLASSGAAEDRFMNPSIADMARPGWYPQMPTAW
jgi:glucarate dehydratase